MNPNLLTRSIDAGIGARNTTQRLVRGFGFLSVGQFSKGSLVGRLFRASTPASQQNYE
jgi:hypothetical protein